jgi:hypothetical protein
LLAISESFAGSNVVPYTYFVNWSPVIELGASQISAAGGNRRMPPGVAAAILAAVEGGQPDRAGNPAGIGNYLKIKPLGMRAGTTGTFPKARNRPSRSTVGRYRAFVPAYEGLVARYKGSVTR